MAENDLPDLILLDIMMPEMDGYETCKQLKLMETTRDIPVIFISALDQTFDKVKAFEMGGVDYITKPFQLKEVLARIENQLTIRHLQIELQKKNQELTSQNSRLQAEITIRERAEEEIRFLLETTQAISESDNFQSSLTVVLRSCCQLINWDFGEAWIPSDDETVLECSEAWYARDESLSGFRYRSFKLTFAPEVGFIGRIWSSQQPEFIEDVSVECDRIFLRAKMAAKAGVKSAFGVPILINDKILAVVVFLKKTIAPYQAYLIELIKAIASQLGSLIQRKQAEEALRIAEQRYHSIVENAIDGIFQSTPTGRYLSANPALAKIYGYDSPESLMKSVKNVSQQLYVDRDRRQEFVKAIETDNAVHGFESMVYRRDGQTIWISENARAVRDSTGKLLYYEGTVSEITERKLAEEALEFQRQRTEELLLNILPAPIADRLKQGYTTIADSFDDASVLFADLVGFTEFSATKSPKELVEILNAIFSQFDRLTKSYGLEKIKTIGDAYMVVGGLPVPQEDSAEAIAQMALDMLDCLSAFNSKTGESLNIRIGINIGPVVAGVIGMTKFIYDLWGDTVNLASRMESTGIPGEIQVTEVVRDRLQYRFAFEKRGLVSIKGKGEAIAYFLKSRK